MMRCILDAMRCTPQGTALLYYRTVVTCTSTKRQGQLPAQVNINDIARQLKPDHVRFSNDRRILLLEPHGRISSPTLDGVKRRH